MNGRSADGTFTNGNSGRPKGARNKATQAVLALLEGEAVALSRKAVQMALAGDGVALRLCLDRIAPPRKDSPVQFRVQSLPWMIELSAEGIYTDGIPPTNLQLRTNTLTKGHLARYVCTLSHYLCHEPQSTL